MNTLTVMRGLPGSGKSYEILKRWPDATPYPLAPEGWSPVVVSGDHFFMDWSTGKYRFDKTKMGVAHVMAQIHAFRAMKAGQDVILDNTVTRRWEILLYLEMAEQFGYKVEIIDLFDGGLTDKQLAARNVHGVPIDTITSMRHRWEKDL